MSSSHPLTILYATQTGNAMTVADWVEERAIAEGFETDLIDMADCSIKKLKSVETLLLIVSTQGEGQPPFDAQLLHTALHGDKAPRLEQLKYSVLSLGDSGYEHFCQTGKDFDSCLERLGAERFHSRFDCDADYKPMATAWIESTLGVLKGGEETGAPVTGREVGSVSSVSLRDTTALPLSKRVLLSGDGSAKEVIHLEFSLPDGCFPYQSGDTLAIHSLNCPQLVEQLIDALSVDGDQLLTSFDGISLRSALTRHLDISKVTLQELERYAELFGTEKIKAWLASRNEHELANDLPGRDWIDIVHEFPPHELSMEVFASSCLRTLPARQYSISSSSLVHPEAIHLTVAVVRYESGGRERQGVCSTYLADRLEVGEAVEAYLQPNDHFRLPEEPSMPIIMIGPGVGIAPFRGFIQERQATDNSGESWLFFGDQHRASDFLYEKEWQELLADGSLTRLDLAFSRDGEQKVYVQQRMRENSQELYDWLEKGAYFYVCGDAGSMAREVESELVNIIAKEGRYSMEEAKSYLTELRKERRYQLDIY